MRQKWPNKYKWLTSSKIQKGSVYRLLRPSGLIKFKNWVTSYITIRFPVWNLMMSHSAILTESFWEQTGQNQYIMAQFETTFQHLPRGTYENHENSQSEQRVSRLSFEPWAPPHWKWMCYSFDCNDQYETNLAPILTCYFSCLIIPSSSSIAVIPSGTLPSSSSLPQARYCNTCTKWSNILKYRHQQTAHTDIRISTAIIQQM